MIRLETPLSKLSFINSRFLKNLQRLGLETVRDLIFHFPTRYEDFSQIYQINDLEPGQQATIQAIIKKVDIRRSFRRHMTIVEATLEDETGLIRAVWFNQPYLKNTLPIGRMMNFSGKVSASENDIYLSHPDYEVSENRKYEETRHTGRLVPVYPETKGLTSRALRFINQPILKNLEPISEFIPKEILEKESLPEINESIQKIHFPDSVEEAERIKKRLAFQDLFLLQLINLDQKMKLAEKKSPKILRDEQYLQSILEALPFKLTTSQKKSLDEIIKDLEQGRPMNRLLQGDVGSGKTVVAAIATLLAARAGFQAVFMAPTEVLASQHFKTMKILFLKIAEKNKDEVLPPVGILTSGQNKIFWSELENENEFKKNELLKKISQGEIKIIIGTHALIQKNVNFSNLGLVIIDEQHRFGVKQRAELTKGTNDKDGKNGLMPHFLSMSATPIPRTLMLTIFGDLDLSIIDELPEGRKEIITKIVAPENRIKAYGFIKGQVEKGRQVFVICPRIDPAINDKPLSTREQKLWEVKSVKEEYEKLSKKIFPEFKVNMLHGQLKPKEKEEVMNRFKDGKIQILISTSVVEVGVDVPNATIMMIEGADRFGLSQLYQFRGRVGRGKFQSFCFLFTDSESKTVEERLKALINAKSGFELAEMDLRFRGPGEFLGRSQTGMPDVAMKGLQNPNLVKSSREAAEQIIKSDLFFKKYPELKIKLIEFQKEIHKE